MSSKVWRGSACEYHVKNLPEIQETLYNSGDAVSITGSGRSPGEGNDIPFSSILSWKIPWTEESAEL